MNNAIYNPAIEKPRAKNARAVPARLPESFRFPLVLVLLHLPLGFFLYYGSTLALLHPIVVFMLGMRAAFSTEEKLEIPAQFAAYIIGAEVLWRMAEVPIFWEFGKYGAAAILITALIRRKLWKIPPFATFYFLLLIPASLIPIVQYSLEKSKGTLSSIMSGPFLLMVSCWFFSHLKLNHLQIRKLLLAMIIPLMSVALSTLFFTVTTEDIQFNGESNFATSGGFGPNQVSSMLGLGAFLCIACFLLFKNTLNYAIYFGVLAVLFSAQSVLTFSRGGMYNAVGAVLLIIVFKMGNLKDGIRRLVPLLAISAVFLLVVFPYLNDFTGGALQERFEDTDPTKRGDIVEADMKIFASSPVLGVGVGNAYAERAKYMDGKAMSHTEFSRLVSEHGSLGLLALVALGLMILANFGKQSSSFGRAFVAGAAGWSILFMLNAGMRLAGPSLVIGMIYLTILDFRTKKADLDEYEKRPPRLRNAAAPSKTGGEL